MNLPLTLDDRAVHEQITELAKQFPEKHELESI
jgi:hypothetical protein